MRLNPQAARNSVPTSIRNPISGKIIHPGLLKTLERPGNLFIGAIGCVIRTKAMPRLFLPADQGPVYLQQIAIRKKPEKVETFHPMVGLDVNRALGTELDIRNAASVAGLKRDREKLFPGHPGLESPQLRSLRLGRGLLDRAHENLEHNLQRAKTTIRVMPRDLRFAIWVRVRPEGLHQLVVSSVEYRYLTFRTAPLLLVDGPHVAGWARTISSWLNMRRSRVDLVVVVRTRLN